MDGSGGGPRDLATSATSATFSERLAARVAGSLLSLHSSIAAARLAIATIDDAASGGAGAGARPAPLAPPAGATGGASAPASAAPPAPAARSPPPAPPPALPAPLAAALARVLLCPRLHGADVDEEALDELARVLPAPDAEAVRAHVAGVPAGPARAPAPPALKHAADAAVAAAAAREKQLHAHWSTGAGAGGRAGDGGDAGGGGGDDDDEGGGGAGGGGGAHTPISARSARTHTPPPRGFSRTAACADDEDDEDDEDGGGGGGGGGADGLDDDDDDDAGDEEGDGARGEAAVAAALAPAPSSPAVARRPRRLVLLRPPAPPREAAARGAGGAGGARARFFVFPRFASPEAPVTDAGEDAIPFKTSIVTHEKHQSMMRAEPGPAAAESAAAAAVGEHAEPPPGWEAAGGYVVLDASPPPVVRDWRGGDVDWPGGDGDDGGGDGGGAADGDDGGVEDGEGDAAAAAAAAAPPPPAASPAADSEAAAAAAAPPSAAGRPSPRGASGGGGARRRARFEAFALRVVYQAGRTGFEDAKDFSAAPGDVVAGRYVVRAVLGSAAFSTAYAATDGATGRDVALKVIKNKKDFLDQSLDEIKLLRYLNHAAGDSDAAGVLRLLDYFYHREHLFLVTELLKDNLYDWQTYVAGEAPRLAPYFTLPRVQRVARQVLRALAFVHAAGLVHCDLKPENVLIASYSRCDVKVIDFGSSCFVSDKPTQYIQSRSYRAPEVVLGLPYGPKIDVWSLGCILTELLTGRVLFPNESVQTMLVRMQCVLGPFPRRFLDGARERGAGDDYFTPQGDVYERAAPEGGADGEDDAPEDQAGEENVMILTPLTSSLAVRSGSDDPVWLDFVTALLQTDPDRRPTAVQALAHPFLATELPFEPYEMG